MLSIFKSNRPASDSDSSSSSSSEERIIPPGTPYLTKINGKLVWARKKTPKVVNPMKDLLGEAFGSRTVIVRKRSRSLERPVTKVLIGNVPVVQQHQVSYSAPLPQQPFPTMSPPMAYYPKQPPPFIWQPTPQPVPQPAQLPHLYIPHQPPMPAPLFVQQSPTEKEKEQLKIFDAHFNNMVKPKTARVTSASSEESQDKSQSKPQEQPQTNAEESTTKVKIAITKHVCGDCGRLRSRKYHHDHPLKPGEVPEVAFCRKCQKDASSTSESSEAEDTHKSKKKEKSKKKVKKNKAPPKPVESSDEDDEDKSSDSPAPKPPKTPKPNQPKPGHPKNPAGKKSVSEDYIVVEEEFSDHERQPRGRSHSRASRENDASRRPLSPINSQLSAPRSRSRSYVRPSPQDYSKNRPNPIEIHEAFREKVRPRSPHIQYRYVEVVPSQVSFERNEPSYQRKAPIHLVDDVVYEKPVSPKKAQYVYRSREGAPSSKAYSVEEPESVARSYHARVDDLEGEGSVRGPPSSLHDTFEVREVSSRGPPSRENSFEVPDAASSMRSSDARRRRKRERATPGAPDFGPREQPHVIHPESDDELVVVKETFEYRKKKQASEDERRRQEYIDRATLSPRKSYQFSADEAARYYYDDWSRAKPGFSLPSLVGKPYQPYQPAKAKKGYRRDRHPESEVTESEASYDYGMSDQHYPPRVPSPPSPIYQSKVNDWSGLKHTDWGDEPLYPVSSGSEHAGRRGKVVHMPPIEAPRCRQNNSSARPTSARGAPDGGSERALIVSPRHSGERSRDSIYEYTGSDLTERQHRDRWDEFSASNITELERLAEVEARHVTFKDTPSLRSLHDNWGTSEGNSQRSRSEYDTRSGGGGWENGGENRGGPGGLGDVTDG
ncbi:hypothetical protein ONS96_003317 [Cadophora gregata f. sp. sojae]|nr:hypothetical protein ONS96_003317 [Cadophora gregata f. sp. sojae]